MLRLPSWFDEVDEGAAHQVPPQMTTDQILLTASVLAPVGTALSLPLLGRLGEPVRNGAALVAVLVSFGCALALLPLVQAGETATLSAGGVSLLHADRLAVFMALVSALLGALILVYSFGYMAGLPHRGEYYVVVVLFLGAMMGLVFARSLLVLYACWEVTAIACWRLIGFSRDRRSVLRADKAFLLTAFGAVVMLLGFVEVHAQAGTFDLGRLQGVALSPLATALILVGLFSKSATLPLHAWLPDAGVAPSPATALLHAAVLVKIGVYAYARLFGATFVIDPVFHEVVPWIAAVSALVAGGAALLENDLKRVIAYSTVSQIGFIFLGLSVGNAEAAQGALLFILMHAIAKGGLFLCAGVVEHAVHTKDLRKLGGLGRRLPVTAVAFALCALSVMGLPPFGGFFSKHLVIAGALAAGRLPVALVFVVGSALTLLYLLRLFTAVFLGEAGEAVRRHPVHEGRGPMIATVAVLGALSLASGLFVRYPSALAGSAAHALGQPSSDATAAQAPSSPAAPHPALARFAP
jgi:NADH:ubiquinone oxidoreductase subunit 5 (subunit L)/multisubunit Na+/H+ antiporter MnhA subunit